MSSTGFLVFASEKSNILNMVYKFPCVLFSVHLPSLPEPFPEPTLLSSHALFLLLPLRSHTLGSPNISVILFYLLEFLFPVFTHTTPVHPSNFSPVVASFKMTYLTP